MSLFKLQLFKILYLRLFNSDFSTSQNKKKLAVWSPNFGIRCLRLLWTFIIEGVNNVY